ncbi:MAG TPA: arginase family protein, partial [Stackebrandtia sp.]|nr:arginase family protein [Stackebrandtia sp.]
MADHNTDGAWDLIVTPWHIDEHLPDFPIPATATAIIPPPLPQGPLPARVNRLHQATADAVAQTTRPLVLSGDCSTTR